MKPLPDDVNCEFCREKKCRAVALSPMRATYAVYRSDRDDTSGWVVNVPFAVLWGCGNITLQFVDEDGSMGCADEEHYALRADGGGFVGYLYPEAPEHIRLSARMLLKDLVKRERERAANP